MICSAREDAVRCIGALLGILGALPCACGDGAALLQDGAAPTQEEWKGVSKCKHEMSGRNGECILLVESLGWEEGCLDLFAGGSCGDFQVDDSLPTECFVGCIVKNLDVSRCLSEKARGACRYLDEVGLLWAVRRCERVCRMQRPGKASIQKACENMARCQVPGYDTVERCSARAEAARFSNLCLFVMASHACADLLAYSWVEACLENCSKEGATFCLTPAIRSRCASDAVSLMGFPEECSGACAAAGQTQACVGDRTRGDCRCQ